MLTGGAGWTSADLAAIADCFAAIVMEAGAAILPVFAAPSGERLKADNSPVCAADELAEELILHKLAAAWPSIPVVSEEAAARRFPQALQGDFILADPLDGTREFLAGRLEFTVNIALISQGWPVAGAVYAPALGELWAGFGGEAPGAWKASGLEASQSGADGGALEKRQAIHTRPLPASERLLLVSRSHIEDQTRAFARSIPHAVEKAEGSSAKFCRIAEGAGDIYPRFSPTMEWDTAAGDAILRAAGGITCGADSRPLSYGKAGYRNGPFTAWGEPAKAASFPLIG